LIFHDPKSKSWQTADAYLSGNVRAKLAAAEIAGPAYARNTEPCGACTGRRAAGDIDANLGAPWIPENDIQAFAAELFKVEPSTVQVGHLVKDAVWSIDAGYAASNPSGNRRLRQARANGTWLLDLALNMKTPFVYDPTPATPNKRVVTRRRRWPPRKADS